MLNDRFISTLTLQLAKLHKLEVFYTPLEARFDRITRLARRALRVPVATLSLAQDERLWFKSVAGWDVAELPIEQSLCKYTMASNEMLVVEDTRNDGRFKQHPLVIRRPGFRFYAGFPLHLSGDFPGGALSVYDTQPRALSPGELQTLRDLGEIMQKELLTNELRDAQAEFIAKLGAARRQASLDDLTRVWARRAGLELLRVAIEEQKGGGTTLAVCMADIDKFKAINDRFGHQVGDQVLRKVTASIVGSLRSEDLVCRYGGDEFLLAIQETSCERLSEIVKRVAERVGEAPVRTRSGDVPVTLSIGVALSGCRSNETLTDVIARADRALYRAKERGRNGVEIEPLPRPATTLV